MTLERAHSARPAGILTLVGLLVMPVIIAGGLLAATWGATDRLDRIQAAVVNLDEGTEIDGQFVPLGRQLAAGLIEETDDNFHWSLADEETSAEGLRSGRFAAVVTIPQTFSDDATSFADVETARRAVIDVQTSTVAGVADGVIGQQIAQAAASTTGQELTESYLDNVYVGFNDSGDQLQQVADGAGELADGAGQLDEGLGQANDGVDQLASGLGELSLAGGELTTGADGLAAGAGALATGLGTAADQTSELPAQTQQLARGASDLATGIGGAATGASQAATGLEQITPGVRRAAQGSAQVTDGLEQVTPGVRQLATGLDSAVVGLRQLSDGAGQVAGGLAELRPGVVGAADGARELQSGSEQLATGLDQASAAASTQIGPAAQDLNEGAAGLAQGADELATGAAALGPAAERQQQGVVEFTETYEQLNDEALQPIFGTIGEIELPEFGELSAMSEATGGLSEELTQLNDSVADYDASLAGLTDRAECPFSGQDDSEIRCETYAAGVADAAGAARTELAQASLLDASASAVTTAEGIDQQIEDLIPDLEALFEQLQAAIDASARISEQADALAAQAEPLRVGGQAVTDAIAGPDGFAAGAQAWSAGAQQWSAGAVQLADGLLGFVDGLNSSAEGAEAIAAGQTELASGLDSVVSEGIDPLTTGAQQVHGGLMLAVEGNRDTPGLTAAAAGADAAAGGLEELAPGSRALTTGLGTAATGLEQVTPGVRTLADGLAAAETGGDALAQGTQQLADGLAQLPSQLGSAATGADQLATGAGQLSNGLTRYVDGVDQASLGAGAAAEGMQALTEGSAGLRTGAGQLADGLGEAADAVPHYSQADRDRLSSVVADPVTTDEFAPGDLLPESTATTLLMIMALWIGALATFLLLAAVPSTALTSRKSSAVLVLQTVLPGALIAVIQAAALTVVGQIVLGLGAGQLFGVFGFLVLAGWTFVAVNHALVAWWGGIGQLISVVMSVLVVGWGILSAVPGWFSALLPLSPLSPALTGIRAIVMDGDGFTGAVIGCLLWLLVGVAASTAAMVRSRTADPRQFTRARVVPAAG